MYSRSSEGHVKGPKHCASSSKAVAAKAKDLSACASNTRKAIAETVVPHYLFA